MEIDEMKHLRLIAVLAVLCLLAGSAFAVSKLMTATVDEQECMGCGKCVDKCPEGAITMNEDGIAVVDKEKCTGCGKCTKSCPAEAISVE
jgi:ferredoxin